MPRTRKPIKVKEPIRLRTKELANGSKSLYLDIYRNGKRTYEYLKMYILFRKRIVMPANRTKRQWLPQMQSNRSVS